MVAVPRFHEMKIQKHDMQSAKIIELTKHWKTNCVFNFQLIINKWT